MLFISLLTTGCEKELDFKYNSIPPQLVIEGTVTQDGSEVLLTWTTPMGEPMDRTPVTDAQVTISDLTNGQTVTLLPGLNGIYTSDMRGSEGHIYRLTVEREGVTYRAESTMGRETQITGMEFCWVRMPYDDVAALQISFTDDPDSWEDHYWLRVYRNGKIYKWAEINDLLSSGGVIDEVLMTSRRHTEDEDEGDILEAGDEIMATVVPVSRAMYEYLEALSIGNSNGPRMFSGGECLGYFLAAPVAGLTITYSPSDFTYWN